MVGDWALWLAARGLPVFPLKPGTKEPLWNGGPYDATTAPDEITRIWAEHPDANIGIAYFKARRPLVLVDCDGEEGIANWARLCMTLGQIEGQPDTLTFRSARGGLHFLFEVPDDIDTRNTTSSLAEHVDTRGKGGYGVGPGSTYEGRTYTVERDLPIAQAPAWFESWLRGKQAAREAQKRTTDAVVLDDPYALSYASAWLENKHAEVGPWGRDDPPDTFAIAARLKDFGVSEAQSVDMMLDGANGERAWLATCIHNVWTYSENEPGCDRKAPASEWLGMQWLAHGQPTAPADEWEGTSAEELEGMPGITFFDPNKMLPYYQAGAVMLVFGPPGAHKTGWVLGKMYQTGARMAYCAGEGIEGVGARLRAYRDLHKIEQPVGRDRFLLYPIPSFGEPASMDRLAQTLETYKPDIVVFDTLATMSGGAEEDEKMAFQLTARGEIGKFAARLKCLVVVIHHSGWDPKHERGTSAFRGNVVATIGIIPNRLPDEDEEPATHLEVRARKMKDGALVSAWYVLTSGEEGGLPVPVECTKAEWLLFHKKGKKHGAPLAATEITEAIRQQGAFSRDKAVTTDILARRLLTKGRMDHEEYQKACGRLARLIEARSEELGGLYEQDGAGRYQWFSTGAALSE